MRWVATPTYLCRMWLVRRLLRELSYPKSFLEVGVGSGDFLLELARHGCEGEGIDISEKAVVSARVQLRGYEHSVNIEKCDLLDKEGRFSAVFAFEVLEHFEDDERVLGKMYDLLDSGGYLMLSVPARMRHWGANDEWAGHLRRYEKLDLKRKAEAEGFRTLYIYSFGVPLINIIKKIYDNRIRRALQKEAEMDVAQRSERSWAVPVAESLHPILPIIFNKFTLYPFFLIQRLFLNTDLGTCYLAVFRKS